MSDCLFCKIISREIPSEIVYEDDKIIAFKDIQPQAPVHVLIVPKEHISTILGLRDESAELIGYLHQKVKDIAEEIGVSDSGFRLVCNHGKDGDQIVPHVHFHLLGGRSLTWPPG
ncbi:MAG: histidine triad nucleotide-binding protein [Candidatus Syntrophonatronum acetioxidans]|uniref:Histidine triad nucleotide-binding protein n=1 Tax=Candidatus Syntrophonatronum acetioxidans TaxID=1795816 RepID=A0A424YCG9_9FIRM|nr:MAG: histidine triad nucleotide-binding protein [Candidatus Syntrophonatronum acetioxidans]